MTLHFDRARHFIPFIHRTHAPGTAPGTLAVDPEAPKPAVDVFGFGPDGLTETAGVDPASLREHLGEFPVVWVNVVGLGDEKTIMQLGEAFDIHRLALEDVVNVHQRAKVEPYEDHLFIVARMVHEAGHPSTEQVSLFIGDNYLVSFQERPGDSFEMVRERIRSGRGRLRHGGTGYLAYALLDALIDAYFPVVERYGERIEDLEEEVLDSPRRDLVSRIHAVKRDLLSLRRVVWPHREALSTLLRQDTPFIDDATRVYLRDCHDHALQLLELIDTYRELASGLLEVHLSAVSHRMNEVMKVLTIFAAIFIPLTFVAGIYGMNFEHMPELRWPFGYPLVLAAMVAIALGLLVFFRRRGWL